MKLQTEAQLQASIVKFLRKTGACFWRCTKERRDGSAIAENKGLPDLFVIRSGRLIGLEVKLGAGKQSPEQIAWETRLRLEGFEYHVVRSIEDVVRILASPAISGAGKKVAVLPSGDEPETSP